MWWRYRGARKKGEPEEEEKRGCKKKNWESPTWSANRSRSVQVHVKKQSERQSVGLSGGDNILKPIRFPCVGKHSQLSARSTSMRDFLLTEATIISLALVPSIIFRIDIKEDLCINDGVYLTNGLQFYVFVQSGICSTCKYIPEVFIYNLELPCSTYFFYFWGACLCSQF